MGLKKPAVGGKKFARGIAKTFTDNGNRLVEINGLSFKPRVVILRSTYDYGSNDFAIAVVHAEKDVFAPVATSITDIVMYTDATVNTVSQAKMIITDNGFKARATNHLDHVWIAYE